MLGILVLRLRTERGGHYSMFPGKLLHGALFRCIAAYDPAFASELHARKMKPFTIGFFQRTGRRATAVLRAQELNEPHYAEGEELLLRLTALDENVLAALLRIPPGTVLAAGQLSFIVEEILADGRENTGVIAEEELIAAALSAEDAQKIRVSFRSPTVFRVDKDDCAVPRPALIFASLADKWTWQGLPFAVDKDIVRAIAAKLIPLDWRGAGVRIRQSERKTMPGFTGTFAFSIGRLSAEEREIILLLTQFAPDRTGLWGDHRGTRIKIRIVL